MKYMNVWSNYLFDNGSFSWFGSSSNKWFSNGTGNVYFTGLTATKYYASFELAGGNYNNSTCYPFQLFFSDNTEINLKWDYQAGFEFRINDVKKYTKGGNTYGKFYKFYIVADTQKGEVLFYIDGNLIYTYSEFVKNNATLTSFRVRLYGFSSDQCTKMKNLIVADKYFPWNETLITLDKTINQGQWSVDSNGDYSTETDGGQMTIKPNSLNVGDGMEISDINLSINQTTAGTEITKIQVDCGNYSKEQKLDTNGQGRWFDSIPTTPNNPITITAKK